MKYTKENYKDYAETKSPKTKSYINIPIAFLVGGAICTVGQGFLNLYEYLGMDAKLSSTLVTVTMIFLGALFTGLKYYDNLAKYAGAGSIIPVTGFANSIVAPAMDFKNEGYVMGMAAKMFTVAGPVLVFGTVTSAVYGIILYIYTLFGGII